LKCFTPLVSKKVTVGHRADADGAADAEAWADA
jgi:hypothetical protein